MGHGAGSCCQDPSVGARCVALRRDAPAMIAPIVQRSGAPWCFDARPTKHEEGCERTVPSPRRRWRFEHGMRSPCAAPSAEAHARSSGRSRGDFGRVRARRSLASRVGYDETRGRRAQRRSTSMGLTRRGDPATRRDDACRRCTARNARGRRARPAATRALRARSIVALVEGPTVTRQTGPGSSPTGPTRRARMSDHTNANGSGEKTVRVARCTSASASGSSRPTGTPAARTPRRPRREPRSCRRLPRDVALVSRDSPHGRGHTSASPPKRVWTLRSTIPPFPPGRV